MAIPAAHRHKAPPTFFIAHTLFRSRAVVPFSRVRMRRMLVEAAD
jgi:hypothetical protein